MTDDAIYKLSNAVVIAELVLPLLLGGPLFFRKEREKRLATAQSRAAPSATPAAALVPLKCASCLAPVPLEAEVFPCPHCGAEVRPPPEYVATLNDRRMAQRALQRAERVWRWTRWTSARPLMWLARVWIVAWMVLVVFACLVLADRWPKMLLALAGILALLFLIVGFAFTGTLGDERSKLPPLPEAPRSAPAEAAACRSCGGPIQFSAGRLALVCPYCAAENYRAAAAVDAWREAAAQRDAASASLVAAVAAVQAQRSEVLAFVMLFAIAEVFYGVLFGLAAVWDVIAG